MLSAKSRRRFRGATVGPFAVGIFFALQLTNWSYGITEMRQWQAGRLHSKISLLFINHFLPDDGRLDVAVDWVKGQANKLDQLGYLKPGLFESTSLSENFKRSKRPLSLERWCFDRAELNQEGELLLEGCALLPKARGGDPAAGVLITLGNGEIVQLACMCSFPYVSAEPQDNEFNHPRQLMPLDFAKWSATLKGIGQGMLRFWAVDAAHMPVYELGGQVMIEKGGTVRIIE